LIPRKFRKFRKFAVSPSLGLTDLPTHRLIDLPTGRLAVSPSLHAIVPGQREHARGGKT
jgi:hypothetical protein